MLFHSKAPFRTIKSNFTTFPSLPLLAFVEILGATLMTITNEDYTNAFGEGNTGALIAQVLSPWGG